MAGYESADHLNAFGERVDLHALTGHLQNAAADYGRLAQFSIRTVREGIRWSHVERRPYVYDWEEVRSRLWAARGAGIQVIWDLCHFGFPDDLTPLHPMFARRFAALSRAFVEFYRSVEPQGELIVTPINEVSFLSWLGGDVRGTSPYCVGQGWEVKYRLAKAYLEGIEALRAADPGIRILTTEPLVNITCDADATPDERLMAAKVHEEQFQILDILGGRMCPELRGHPGCLDLIGVNFYYSNQWVRATHETLVWTRRQVDPRWRPLHSLLADVYARYRRPLILAETSHPGEDRPEWIRMIAAEVAAARAEGIPLWGVCWYPMLDRPDWDHLDQWHRAGVWDHVGDGLPQVQHAPTAEALLAAQTMLGH